MLLRRKDKDYEKSNTIIYEHFNDIYPRLPAGNRQGSNSGQTSQPTESTPLERSDVTPETDGRKRKNAGCLLFCIGQHGSCQRDILRKPQMRILFELVPVEPYSDEDLDWTTDGSRVNKEHDDEGLRDIELVETTVPDWDSYDTVFIGYPIWWGIAAWPVDGFIEANDFTGKTVIPFCTSASSGLGESGELLAEAAGTGNWLEGQRFSSRPSEEEVRAWVDGLGLQ